MGWDVPGSRGVLSSRGRGIWRGKGNHVVLFLPVAGYLEKRKKRKYKEEDDDPIYLGGYLD